MKGKSGKNHRGTSKLHENRKNWASSTTLQARTLFLYFRQQIGVFLNRRITLYVYGCGHFNNVT